METKVCIVCQQSYVYTKEYFTVDKRTASGLTSKCRICERKRINEYHRNHPERSKAYREKNHDVITAKKRSYYSKNKSKINAKNKANYKANQQHHYETSRIWQANHKDEVNAYYRKYYEQHKEQHLVHTKQWKNNNRELVNNYWEARRVKKLGLCNTLTVEQWKEIKLAFDNKCAYCGKDGKLTQDHFIPIIRNGDHSIINVIPSCLSCNSSKSIKSFFNWYPTHKYYSVEREQIIIQHIELMRKASHV